jgi:hypothetical protein
MNKDGQVKLGCTPCDYCSNPGTTIVNGRLYCSQCAPNGEKRAEDLESLKSSIDRLTDLHK